MQDVLLTGAQMRALEQAAIASGAVTGLELMERAGRGAVDAILAEWPELARAPGKAVVLCGPGNNGGDGFVVARLLRQRGWEVEVYLYGDPERLPPDARVNYERWGEMGEISTSVSGEAEWDLFIDAGFGIGLRRPLEEAFKALFEKLSARSRKTVALDVPSGLCADSGRILDGDDPKEVDLTVTFEAPKPGHHLAQGPEDCGKLTCVNLGIAGRRPCKDMVLGWRQTGGLARLETGWRVRNNHPDAPTSIDKGWIGAGRHKFDHGHALVLSGGVGRGGAARLAARGALRIGTGLVTVGCPPAALLENGCHLNAIMLRAIADADALAEALTDKRITALCLGPGLGLGEREAGLVAAALSSGLPTALDADALTLLAGSGDLRALLHPDCILTPHAGEFARLCPDISEKLAELPITGPAYSKLDATSDAAARLGCTVLFKGPDTVIARQDGHAAIHAAAYDRAAPWLATAGSGDVLAGLITGLLARGNVPLDAAGTAAYLHMEAARAFGPGLIAEDLPEMIPTVLRNLTAPPA